MSTRANVTATLAGLGVLALGWTAGTNGGATLTTQPTRSTAGGTATSATNGKSLSTTRPVDDTESDNDSEEGASRRGTTGGGATTTGATTTGGTTTGAGNASSTLADGTYTGKTVYHRYGAVSVTVTVSGGVVRALAPTVMSNGDRHSDGINTSAIPVLESEVLAANSADVQTISGATYTTQAYLQSLQSALDQA